MVLGYPMTLEAIILRVIYFLYITYIGTHKRQFHKD